MMNANEVQGRRMELALALQLEAGDIDALVESVLNAREDADESDESDEDVEDYDYDDGMDGDHDSAMASAGWGTDEDYGFGGDDDGGW